MVEVTEYEADGRNTVLLVDPRGKSRSNGTNKARRISNSRSNGL